MYKFLNFLKRTKKAKVPYLQEKKLLRTSNHKLNKSVRKYREVFQEELHVALPPKAFVNHELEVNKEAKTPHRPLYQPSPTELKAAKSYGEDLLRKGKL